MFAFGCVVGGAAVGAAVWFGKDAIVKWYKGAEDYVAYLKDKIEKVSK